ncbi:helix-turn-helix domain-containing protein [Jannaschia seohaensis]|uniref:DNA binding domain-containing protein, excisionase family n=1 Tax=Jannaschia seohaensis TaxID=475081 RepID=A0A2Y9ANI2_9RHOB|nr:helix-turn-helix domain-containing protein [Jannaschia seohaensis]PWJ19359.1 excisionase family DNA binding protein [Jannaschia seohaensis]SSA46021.1 DNA binding domain-containing protein, excisionase family [Jannaschia seohaensis]
MADITEILNQVPQIMAVSPNEAARLCSIGRTTLYAALSSGELKSVKIGTRRLITLEALREWLQRNETAGGK